MAIAPQKPKTYTPEEYFTLEVESELRHEYRNGEIIPMSGGTPAPNEIAGNLMLTIKSALKGQPYSIFIADQRVWIPEYNFYTYPDIVVVPRPIALQPGRKDTIISPLFIAEVLSNSTKAYDRDENLLPIAPFPLFRNTFSLIKLNPMWSSILSRKQINGSLRNTTAKLQK